MDEADRFDIYVPREVKRILENDANLFEFYKKDNSTVNMNRFLTAVIRGYYTSYVTEQNEALDRIASEIRDIVTDPEERAAVAARVCDRILFSASWGKESTKKERISLKPTKEIQQIIKSIPTVLDVSVSKYFCKLFVSYANKPISQRERIIFAERMALLEEACKNGWNLELTTTVQDTVRHVIPYDISTGREELFNYLVCAEVVEGEETKTATFRLNRIDWIGKSAEKAVIPDDVKQNLARMIAHSPLYSVNNDPMVRIKMTDKGRDLYRKIYYGRPACFHMSEETDGGCIMSFECSVSQAFFYFRRFDQDTIEILEPPELFEEMREFFAKAIKPLGLTVPVDPDA